MPRLRTGRPIWSDSASRGKRPRFPRQRGTIDTDVAIVGGGITGAIAAYVFAEAGVSVTLLEANRIASGSTAASTALLMQEPDKDLRELSKRYGRARARRIWRAIRRANNELIAAIRRARVPCDLRTADSIYYAARPDALADLKREFRARRAAGLRATWLSDRGILTRGNAQVDPVRACVGFVRRARALGARVFEASRVRRVRATDDGVTITTTGGQVRARVVVVATGYATPEFRPLAGRFRMLRTFVIATRRLPARVRRRLPGSRVMLWDTNRPYHYFRWTGDRRVVFGGADQPQRPGRSQRRMRQKAEAALIDQLNALYPVVGDKDVTHFWEGLFAQTPDGLPYVGPHRRYPRHLFALGYGGNGMSVSYLAAAALLRHYRGASTADDRLFAFSR